VIIPSRKLRSYFKVLQFPVRILEEKGNGVARFEDREGLMALIEAEVVIGIGTWNRIRHLRLNRPVNAVSDLRIKLRYPLSIPASRTVVTEKLESGRNVHRFEGTRCIAYRDGRPRLDFAAL
jgi:hypothetical protein